MPRPIVKVPFGSAILRLAAPADRSDTSRRNSDTGWFVAATVRVMPPISPGAAG